jgi:APA family basic amino acid/polyamine antiporter
MSLDQTDSAPEDRKLGLWMCTALVVGNMIGSGVFLLPAALGSFGGISLVGWLLTAVGALFLALAFARLSRIIPGAGGPYAYTRHALGDFAGFIVAWGYWISIWVGNAAISVAMVGYLAVFWPPLTEIPILAGSTALAAIWFLTWVNASGVRNAGMVQLVTTVMKLVPLVAVATVGLLFIRLENFTPFNLSGTTSLSAVTATATLTLWAFLGLESATIPSGSVDQPERTIPRATIIGTLLTAAVYIGGTFAVMGIIPPDLLTESTAPFADAASEMFGPWASYAVALGATISCFGALNGWILLQGQVPLASASDGLFPGIFGRLSPRGTPVAGIVISSSLVTLLMAMNYTRGLVDLYTFVILLATLTTLIPYVLSVIAELIIFQRERYRFQGENLSRPKIIAGIALIYSLWAIAGLGWQILGLGFLLLLAGVPIFLWMRHQAASG